MIDKNKRSVITKFQKDQRANQDNQSKNTQLGWRDGSTVRIVLRELPLTNSRKSVALIWRPQALHSHIQIQLKSFQRRNIKAS